ncbi:unnamed protein product [Caenorhabditis auriculariae]|uniref:TIL domain-containing protein n=1 Tax=Caenorhabditis auriculariae TaxID=2777116 RepID=A0A8S1HNZ7_9PELO|nr:unnamed protein product [Caenorhabditis auriculariae]
MRLAWSPLSSTHALMRSLTLFVFFTSIVSTTSLDWCEYWTRMGKQSERPECVGFQLQPGEAQNAPTKRPTPAPQPTIGDPIQCPSGEMYSCIDCEPTCHNLVPKCRKEQCNKGCVCKMGLARGSRGKCIPFRECASHAPPQEEGTVMQTVRKMVPVIVNDVWKAFFASIRPTTTEDSFQQPQLKPVNETNPPEPEITGSPIHA